MEDKIKEVLEKLIPKFEKPGSTNTILLCQTTADIIRWRIYIHKKLNIESLFNVRFFTLDDWLKDTIQYFQEFGRHEKIQTSPFIEEIILEKVINENKKENSYFSAIENLSGFKTEVLNFYRKYIWLHDTLMKSSQEKKSAKTAALLDIFSRIDNELKKHGYINLPSYLRLHKKEFLNQENNETENQLTRNIIWLFPLELNEVEYHKLEILNFFYKLNWNILTINSKTENSLQKKFLTEIENKKIYSFKKNKNDTKIQIFKTESLYSEACLALEKTLSAIERNIPLYDIQIMYADKNILHYLAELFNERKIPLDIRDKVKDKTFGYFWFIAQVIDILILGFFSRRKIQIDELLKIFTSAFFKKSFLHRKLKNKITDPYLWQKEFSEKVNFLAGDLEFLLSIIKNHPSKIIINFFDTLSLLIDEIKVIKSFEKPSYYADILHRIIRKYSFTKETISAGINKDHEHYVKDIFKLLDQFRFLDEIYPENIKRDKFFEMLKREINSTAHNIYRANDMNKDDSLGITIRHVSEGLHSAPHELIVCALNFAYPSFSSISGILDFESEFTKKLIKSNKFYEISKNIEYFTTAKYLTLSYNVEKEPYPSDIIIEIFRNFSFENANNALKNKESASVEEIIDCIPFYEKMIFEGETISVNNSSNILLKRYEKNIKQFAVNEKENDLKNGLDKKDQIIENKISVSNLITLSECPKKYWFQNRLNLKNNLSKKSNFNYTGSLRGELFHSAAAHLMKSLKKEDKNSSYRQFALKIEKKHLRELLNDSFDKALFNIKIPGQTGRLLTADESLQRIRFIEFFENFFLLARENKHPFSENIPFDTEYKFEDIYIEPFYIRGRIDRIDYNLEKKLFTIIDYKTGKQTAKNENLFFDNLFDLQLIIYIKAAEENFGSTKDKSLFSAAISFIQDYGREKITPAAFLQNLSREEINNFDFMKKYKESFHTLYNILLEKRFLPVSEYFKKDKYSKVKDICENCLYHDICRY
ncbi:MAG: PD-(D/E)XK nuclease family protein [Spirochaetia bacterium]|nr:PD-(D/E)XK nuclease family protein [Spirochaetia bacterium]